VTLLHPEVRIPTWAAVAVVGAAYVIRAVFVRGGDFRPDLPTDLIVAALLAALLGLRAALRRSGWDRPDETGMDHRRDDGQTR
jgi:hypothetical protein